MTRISCESDRPNRPDWGANAGRWGGNSDGTGGIVPLRVLVVDDAPLIRWSVAETLADAGLYVEQAGDAAAAMNAITTAAGPFDAIVLDLRLPDMKDLSLLAAIRHLLPRANVVVITAYGTPELLAGALQLGVRTVLHKPFEFADLRRAVVADRLTPR